MIGLAGLGRGETRGRPVVRAVGEGMLDSLPRCIWPGRDRAVTGDIGAGTAALRRGDSGFDDRSESGLSTSIDDGWSRIEYGPAVAGRATSGRLLDGLIGATDMPPAFIEMDGSARDRTAGFVATLVVDVADELDTFLVGEKCAMADPGRAGTFLAEAAIALFWPSMASRRLGLLAVAVLLDRPRAASTFFGELGLLGSFWRSFCAVASRSPMILYSVSCYPRA